MNTCTAKRYVPWNPKNDASPSMACPLVEVVGQESCRMTSIALTFLCLLDSSSPILIMKLNISSYHRARLCLTDGGFEKFWCKEI